MPDGRRDELEGESQQDNHDWRTVMLDAADTVEIGEYDVCRARVLKARGPIDEPEEIETDERTLYAKEGDYIIRTRDWEVVYPVAPDDYWKTRNSMTTEAQDTRSRCTREGYRIHAGPFETEGSPSVVTAHRAVS